MIHVGIVEDQKLVREGLQSLLTLTPDIRAICHAPDGREGLRLLNDPSLDVLLVDLRMPEMDGIDLLTEAARMESHVPVIILTTFHDDENILRGIHLGARGFLMKDVSLATLSEAIRTVVGGGTVHRPVATERVMDRLRTASKAGMTPASESMFCEKLTDREIQVLRLMFAGFSNGEIGYAIHLSEGTVKNHVSSILAKLGARDRIRAVLRGVEEGYISPTRTQSSTVN